jgi:uncharacterized protein
MKILIDVGHPAHVHLFKHLAWAMQKKGHDVLFTTRDKEMAIALLRFYEFNHVSFGKPYKSKSGKIWGMLEFDWRLLKTSKKFRPDIFISHGSIYAAQVAWLLRKPHIALEDTGNMEQVRLYLPFSKAVLTSTAFQKKLGKKQIFYNGYHELAYLQPKYFVPNHDIFGTLGVADGSKYIILRFVSWHASHDYKQIGIDLESKRRLVAELEKHARVFISSEAELPLEFGSYQIKIPSERIHDALAFATMFIGEGATMASECAMLGTPAIYVNSISAGTLEEQERYGLLFGFRSPKGFIEKAVELLAMPNLRAEFQNRRQKMLSKKIDVTSFLLWFVENYPQSVTAVRKNPDIGFNRASH